MLRLLALLCLFFTSILPAAQIPKAHQGVPMLYGNEGTNLRVGCAKIQLPAGWGVGESSFSAHGGSLYILPLNKGYGCLVKIEKCTDAEQAKTLLNTHKKAYPKAVAITNGFEASHKKGWVAYRVDGEFLVHLAYTVPAVKKEHANHWKIFKEGVTCTNKAPSWKPMPLPIIIPKIELLDLPKRIQDNIDKPQLTPPPLDFNFPKKPIAKGPYAPVTKAHDGWWCHHPDNKLHVVFESFPLYECGPNPDKNTLHLLRIGKEQDKITYFFVKWDQKDLDTHTPFQIHLTEMMQEIVKLHPEQNFDAAPIYLNKHAVWKGNPYSLYTIGEKDGFLYSFAVNQNDKDFWMASERLYRRVKWVKE